MKFDIKLLSMFMAAIALIACSESTTENGETITKVVSASIDVVDNVDDLPSCDKDMQGREIYVTAEKAIYACFDNSWEKTSKVNESESFTSMLCNTKPLMDSSGVQIYCGDSLVTEIHNGKKGPKGVEGEKGLDGETGADGAEGAKGNPGIQGKRGEKGVDGENGTNGSDGNDGEPGEDCSAAPLDDNSGIKIMCGGDSVAVILNGENGSDGADGDNGGKGGHGADCYVDVNDGYVRQICDGDVVNTVYNGSNGTDGENGVPGKNCYLKTMAQGGLKVMCGEDSVGVLMSGTNGANGMNGVDGANCATTANGDGSYTMACGDKKMLLDDFEDADTIPLQGVMWVAFVDAAVGGMSTVSHSFVDGDGPGKAYRIDFVLDAGDAYVDPYVGISLVLNENSAMDLSYCDTVVYSYKGAAHYFRMHSALNKDYGDYQVYIGSSDNWVVQKVALLGLEQPSWAEYVPVESVRQSIYEFVWNVSGYSGDEGSLVIDNIQCKDESGKVSIGIIENGKNGTDGKNGVAGANCTIAANGDGSGYTVTCNGKEYPLTNAKDGGDGSDGKNGTSCVTEPTADGSKLKVMCPKVKSGVVTYDSIGVITNAAEGTYCAMIPVWKAPNDSRLICGLKKGDPKPEYAKIPWSHMNPLIEYDVFIDERDGQPYRSVSIGTQVWMAENLNYADSINTPSLKNSSWCYNNNEALCSEYGRLYNWGAVMDSVKTGCGYGKSCTVTGNVQGICPKGWHVPTNEEWNTLFDFTRGTGMGVYSVYEGGTDLYGMSVLNAGCYGTYPCSGFAYLSSYVYLWTATQQSSDDKAAMVRGLTQSWHNTNHAHSLRCLKD